MYTDATQGTLDWPLAIFESLKKAKVRQIVYVPDAGHAQLIEMAHNDPSITTTVLTTEEEGIAIAAGAWLGGERAALLMQSSGVGNCINMFSLLASCRFPFLTLVTMRGEWSEFNPWQIPMGQAVPQACEMMGLQTLRVDDPVDAAKSIDAAATLAFESDRSVAVLLSQKMLGRKKW